MVQMAPVNIFGKLQVDGIVQLEDTISIYVHRLPVSWDLPAMRSRALCEPTSACTLSISVGNILDGTGI